MDHPGYVGGEFLGGVPPEYLESGAARRDFGRFAMWDLPACEISQGRIHSRACDNLISCASILAVFQELEHEQAETAVMAAFTCAEEVGLLGAVYLARGGAVPPDVRVLSLETSAERPPAQMGHGVVVRVGDRTSIFDPRLTSELASCAAESGVQHQRCLMSGGTCEATAYQLYGYRVAGLCVPLGNYHNCAPNHQIGAEYVDMGDVLSMVHLCNAIVRHKPRQRPWTKLKAALELRLNEALTHRF
ncbi:MAG: hypothetical protein RLZZ244_242 [Verrucomicrobiota bacterium]|jgi:putative aminopeptidase FrvX